MSLRRMMSRSAVVSAGRWRLAYPGYGLRLADGRYQRGPCGPGAGPGRARRAIRPLPTPDIPEGCEAFEDSGEVGAIGSGLQVLPGWIIGHFAHRFELDVAADGLLRGESGRGTRRRAAPRCAAWWPSRHSRPSAHRGGHRWPPADGQPHHRRHADSTGGKPYWTPCAAWPWIRHCSRWRHDRRRMLDKAAFLDFVVEIVAARIRASPSCQALGRRAHLRLAHPISPPRLRL